MMQNERNRTPSISIRDILHSLASCYKMISADRFLSTLCSGFSERSNVWALGLRGGKMNLINELGCECMFILLQNLANSYALPTPRFNNQSELPQHDDVALVKQN